MVVLVPVPDIAPGLMVQVPVAGNPLKTTLPVDTLQVNWVIVPIAGAVGTAFTVSVAAFDVALLEPVQLVT